MLESASGSDRLSASSRASHILVVDDHGLFRSGLRLILESHFAGFSVTEAGALEDALAIGGSDPALILLDVILNSANGLDSFQVLRARWPLSPVIVVSADDRAETKDRALALGAAGYVSKSSGGRILLDVVADVLGLSTEPANAGLSEKKLLSARQLQVLNLMRQGLSNKRIAKQVNLSEFTVRGHVQSIFKVLGVNSRSAAVFNAHKAGLIR
ncbi:response regulator [Mesorhizobium sp.]|jgi:DNA-binding NarL/FixJ family response regulator|uniref:response regulator n=1 Tax=Mesorhizobium sp. TaxID=1871066 RepID=UPI003567183D